MPSPLELRQRIRSVRNTRQITRAMQLVAASRMRRAQEAVEAARPYADEISRVIRRLAEASAPETLPVVLRPRPVTRVAYVVMTTNRGLVGPLNTNMVRLGLDRIADAATEVSVIVIGRKGQASLQRAVPLAAAFTDIGDRPTVEDVLPIARLVIDGYERGEFDEAQLVYPVFVNTLIQRPTAVRLLPVVLPDETEVLAADADVIYEPSPAAVLDAILPRFIETVLYRAFLELAASEQSARMVAMRNATDNATELIESLSLAYNKLRQARITNEIIDISAGANALAEA